MCPDQFPAEEISNSNKRKDTTGTNLAISTTSPSDLKAKCQQSWKWVAYISSGLFFLFLCVIAVLLMIFSFIYGVSADQTVTTLGGVILILLTAVGSVAIGFQLVRGVYYEGKTNPRSYKKNALEVLKLYTVAMAVLAALYAVLSMVIKAIQ